MADIIAVRVLSPSAAIAALAFGVTIGNIETVRIPIFRTLTAREPVGLNETEKIFFSEVAFLLKTFFFIYLGISLELIGGWLIIVGLHPLYPCRQVVAALTA